MLPGSFPFQTCYITQFTNNRYTTAMGHVGNRKEFVGHCWLVRQGEPYLEKEDPRSLYTEMYHISREDSRKPIRTGAIGLGRLTHS